METTFSVYSKIETEKLLPENDEDSVFSRQEALDTIDQEKNENAKVVIIGGGGLGSIVAMNLARMGIGHIVVCDGDTVELSNLNRQRFYAGQIGDNKAMALADNLENECTGETIIEAYAMYFQMLFDEMPQAFLGADVILCLVDNEETRNDACRLGLELNTPVIFSAISLSALNGYVAIQENRKACFNCIRPRREEGAQRGECFDPAVIYTHQMAMGIATYATISIIQGWERLWNYYLFMLDTDSYARTVARNEDCEICGGMA